MKNGLMCEQVPALASRSEVVSFPPPPDCFNKEGSEVTYQALDERPAVEGMNGPPNGERGSTRPQKRKPGLSHPGGML